MRAKQPQYLIALARANKIRLQRAALKRRIAAEDFDLAAATLSKPPRYAANMRVWELLAAMPYVREKVARKLMADANVRSNGGWRTVTLSELTPRERVSLVVQVKGRGERWKAKRS